MTIPTYEQLMLPMLKILQDGKPHKFRALIDLLADEFSLSDEEREKTIPSGRQTFIQNRTEWAKTHLNRAGLVDVPERGVYQINQNGLDVLKQNPEKLDNNFLRQFPSFVEWFDVRPKQKSENIVSLVTESKETPEELLGVCV